MSIAASRKPGVRFATLGGSLHTGATILLLAGAYAIAGRVGLAIAPVNIFASPVWAPTGVALAVLLRGGLRYWPGVALGAFLVNAWTGAPIPVAVGISAGNTLEAVLGALLVRRVAGEDFTLDRLRDVLAFVGLGALVSTMASATLGVSSLVAAGLVPMAGAAETWSVWWLGDAVGDLVVASPLLAWTASRSREDDGGRRRVEVAALTVVLIAASAFVFFHPPVAAPTGFLHACLLIPLLVWGAVRFEVRGATAWVLLACVIAIAGTASGRGPFVQDSVASSLLHQQAFMAVVAVAVLMVAAITAERGEVLRRCRRSEQALRESQRELTFVADVTPLMLARCNRELRYRFVNRAYAEMLGRTPEQVVGRHVAEILGARGYDTLRPHVEAVLRGRTVEFDDDVQLAGIRSRTLRAVYVPERDEHGAIVGWLASIIDVTERRRAEEALREANRRKSDFLGVLSHELRNPLAPIRNGLFVLRRSPPGSEQAARATDVIDRQTRQLTRLVDDLLDVTRISRGVIQLHRTRVDLAPLVRHAVEDHRPLFTTRDIALDLRVEGEPLWIDADATRVTQIVGNLLHNAAKFTDAGGRVSVRAGEEGGSATIRVVDDGAGMAPEMLPRIFEPFTQADATLHRTLGGLGLGLALVKGIVEMHGGEVEARSEGLGRGSELTVRLPLLGAAAVEQREPAAGAAAIRRRRVLVIEDNLDAAETIKVGLEMSGHEVAVAHDGREGLARARSLRPDVVLCDIGLPGIDGYEVARRIRADPSLSPLLVAVTGYALPDDKRRASDAGFDRHLAKPFEFRDLEEALARPEPGRGPRPGSG